MPQTDTKSNIGSPTSTKFLDEVGLQTLWKKIKDRFDYKIIKTGETTLSLETGTYYVCSTKSNSFTFTLPSISDTKYIKGVIVFFTTDNNPSLNITNTNVTYINGENVSPNATHELNAIYNGTEWIVAITNNVANSSSTEYSILADVDLKTGTETAGKLITAKLLKDNYNITDGTVNIGGNSITPITTLKTINGQSLVGEGNITVSGGGESGSAVVEQKYYIEPDETFLETIKNKSLHDYFTNDINDGGIFNPMNYSNYSNDSDTIIDALNALPVKLSLSGTTTYIKIYTNIITGSKFYYAVVIYSDGSLEGSTLTSDFNISYYKIMNYGAEAVYITSVAKLRNPNFTGMPTAPSVSAKYTAKSDQVATITTVSNMISSMDVLDMEECRYIAIDCLKIEDED